jgi:enoyl-CoA hydratase
MPAPVTLAIANGIATLTLDDGKANALSQPMAEAIGEALDQASSARAVVLRGRPGVLCAGFDLKVIRAGTPDQRSAMTRAGYRLLARLYLLPKPLVIACTGHAIAAGALMLLTGDVRIGVRGEFRIGLNETAIGLALPQIGIELARERLAPAALPHATIAARLYSPDDAAAAGYLEQAADPAALDATIAAALDPLLRLDAGAYATTKQRLRQGAIDRAAADLTASAG